MIKGVRRHFSKTKLSFVKELQEKLRGSAFRERLFNPDFKVICGQQQMFEVEQLNLGQLESCLVKPFWDLARRESKFMRPVLIHIAADLLDISDQERVTVLSGFIECLHNTTLILDDVIDGSTTRRGGPCVHLTYGIDTALTCYGYINHFLIRSVIDKLKIEDSRHKSQAFECILKCLEELYIGLAWDVEWHKDKSLERIPTFENFFYMLELKTAKLLNLANELFGILYDIPQDTIRDLKESYSCFGISFQINDDLININDTEYAKLKGIGDDIIESKLSFPVLSFIEHHRQNPEKLKELFDAMNVKEKSNNDIQRVLDLVQSVDCNDKGIRIARHHMDKCYETLTARFGSESKGVKEMKQLGEYILSNEFLKQKN